VKVVIRQVIKPGSEKRQAIARGIHNKNPHPKILYLFFLKQFQHAFFADKSSSVDSKNT